MAGDGATVGVAVLAYGTPRGPEEVEAYYTDIRRGRPPTPDQLADLVRRYEAIGGVSPLRERTEAQRAGLQAALDRLAPGRFRTTLGFKHASPSIEEAVDELAAAGAARITAVVLAPHYSELSVGEYLARATERATALGLPVSGLRSWHVAPAYLAFLADGLAETLAGLPERTRVLFTAHSLPARIVEAGDPYPHQLLETAVEASALLAERGFLRAAGWDTAWQSAGRTPEPWLGPDLSDVIRALAGTGDVDGIAVSPCGFVADHLEVLYDVDIEARAAAEAAGLAFGRAPVVNDDQAVLDDLARLVAEEVPVKVAVVGGGIAGLAAAHDLARGGAEVMVLEASPRAGGKLHTQPFAGVDLETAPDSFLARRPEAVDLCRELGLADELVAPSETSAYVYARGRLRRLPGGTVLGVPTQMRPLARSGVLSPAGVARAAVERWLPGRPLVGDTTVGELIGRRFGRETSARLVDPLVGGINAGHTDRLSVDVVAPQLAAAARRDRSLVRALRSAPTPSGAAGAPVFLTLPGGLSRLVDALVSAISSAGGDVRVDAPVRSLAREGAGYVLDDGSGDGLTTDGVVLATPADVTAGLLATTAPEASTILGGVSYASVALVTLAFPEEAVRRPLDASGFVVPRPEGLTMTGCTWADRKWAHLRRPGQVLVRASAGRVDNHDAALPDDELVGRLLADLGTTMDLRGEPTAVAVHRWPRSFPQYAPGHLDRIARARQVVADALPGVALAGAALAGVGIPACIGTGQAAARDVVASGARS